ncbi:Ca2+-binding RTX toxin-like protein [Amaricoccus macauensis]|uniref:Ca2+-binding RTX toxin-like protein n=1 Tax=Amaricoccus macauensis TaxID=57001 RepID=A0A840SV44_9RHOB|nr:calcium-binding protein [Amaricoccus macauensis]MBB5223021.1 Ca2+-binding RTX toxin-like protein [Amaricoccus macauensis]
MTTTPVLSIDATALSGIDFASHFTTLFASVGAGDYSFYGGTPDRVFGAIYYLNGSQIVASYAGSSIVTMMEGEALAYDYLHYGASFGHGISGTLDSVIVGEWVDGVTTGTQGTGAPGRVTGLDNLLVLDGFDLTAAPGAGHDPATNTVYAMQAALNAKNATAIYDIVSGYALDVTGSGGRDKLNGYTHDDTLSGGAGNDQLAGKAGADVLHGNGGADALLGGAGKDALFGGSGTDALFGDGGADTLTGGTGADKLVGGLGADTFVFAAGDGADRILDFSLAQDRIDLAAFDLGGLGDIGIADRGYGAHISVDGVTIDLRGIEAADLGADHFLL